MSQFPNVDCMSKTDYKMSSQYRAKLNYIKSNIVQNNIWFYGIFLCISQFSQKGGLADYLLA